MDWKLATPRIDLSQSDIVSCDEVMLDVLPESPEPKFIKDRTVQMRLMDGEIDRYLVDLTAIEPLSRESFLSLLEGFEGQGKAFIIAVVVEREIDQPSQLHPFFFAAGLLVKMILKRTGQNELISRYSPHAVFYPNNPLTNLPIVGEVEFFLSESQDQAKFIGTDYTLWKRKQLQEVFISNAQWDLDEWNSAQESVQLTDLDAASLEALSHLIDLHRSSLLSVIRIPFKQAITYGIFCTLMLVVYAAGFVFSLLSYISLKLGDTSEISLESLCLLPLIAVCSTVFDWWTCRLFKQKEGREFFTGKIVAWVGLFAFIPVVLWASTLTQPRMMFLSAAMGYFVYHTLYSLCLFIANVKHQRPE